jgi:hypothetical protein
MSTITNLTIELVEKFISEAKKEQNINQIKRDVMDPLIEYMFQKLYPYIIITSILFILIFILATAIFYMTMKKHFNVE